MDSTKFDYQQYLKDAEASQQSPLPQKVIPLGKGIEVYGLPEFRKKTGRYLLSLTNAADTVEKSAQYISNFVGSKLVRALPWNDFKFLKFKVEGSRVPIAGVPISLAIDFWAYQTSKGNLTAIELLQKISGMEPVIDNPFADYSGIQVCFPKPLVRITLSPERKAQIRLAKELKGETEVLTEVGSIDVLTKTEIIEVKLAKGWKHAIGQVVCYGFYYPSLQKRIHLVGKCHPSMTATIEKICLSNGVIVSWEPK